MKKLIFALLFFLPAALLAQQQASLSNPLGGDINAASTNCSVVLSCVWQKLPATATTTTITISGTFVATLPIETSADGGVTFTTSSTQSAATVVTLTTTSLTDVRVRASAYTSGKASVNIQTAGNQISVTVNQGGGVTTTASIPGTPGLTGVPVTSGLMAEYRMLPTETCPALLDYSGNSANATGTVGVAPTIIANTGGCNFTGNGAVSLPASLNSALTVVAYFTFQGTGNGANGVNAILQGNGNGTNNGGNGMWLASCSNGGNSNPGGGPCAAWIGGGGLDHNNAFVCTWGNNLFNTMSWMTFNGSGSYAMALTPTGDNLYLNGSSPFVIGFKRNPGTAGLQTTGNYQLGGAGVNIGQNGGAATWFNGQIYYIVFYNRVLNASEIAQVSTYMQTQMNLRGVTPAIPSNPVQPLLSGSDATNQLLALGTSITAGNGTIPYTTPMTNGLAGGPWNVFNLGAVGQTTVLLQQQMPFLDNVLRPIANKNAVVFEAATNDALNTQALAANAVGLDRAFCNARHALGWKCIVISMLARNDTQKNLYNAELRQRWWTFADGMVDVAADVNMGADGAQANTTYFSDTIHPTQYAFYNHYAWPIQRAVNALYGNRSFSEATTYVAPALAATATTAGTSGSNTITITFGATPANCQVGNRITLAGITPAGYNDTYLILTRSATQITAWASAALLGPITVQGTGVCPQQQDADVYTILNFGAGNFTLESCVGYTGQNLYIKNINAGASTIVPFGTETIDGAANLAIAQNVTRILQSQLISAAVAGCTWKVLQ